MSDLTDRLREWGSTELSQTGGAEETCHEAADCIDKLIAAAELYIKEPYCNQSKALQQAIKEAKGEQDG